MKKLINVFVCLAMLSSSSAFAECKWATGIKKTEGGYLYSDECHGRVGLLVKDMDDLNKEVESLRKTIDLKNLALDKADERVMLWRKESYEQFQYLQAQQELARKNETLWFVLGIVVTGAAVWGAGQLR